MLFTKTAGAFLLLIGLISSAYAGKVRRDCGETKLFIATNECGVTYGGTWIECATGISAIPTFSVSECTNLPASNTTPTAEVTLTSFEPVITPAPGPWYPTGVSKGNTTCSALWICVDAIAVCGGETVGYGACYNTCTKTKLTPLPCTLPSVTPTPTSESNSTSSAVWTPPPRSYLRICEAKPWMCAPKGW
ncbi:hypothetical protein EK21DRAFT_86034 [Setomelanomma holmii]|uniref:Uncharacterized protein n=1 Tax=Setomelanomma holmii TaxID=210430 RepID=A0A9P4HG77_9PLEO|nr:hypothetical protein EK21DRAFT_86034 [Setomelanomma holmii]